MQSIISSPKHQKDATLRTQAQRFFKWWLAALASCIPEQFTGNTQASVKEVDLSNMMKRVLRSGDDNERFAAELKEILSAETRESDRISVLIDRSCVFERSLNLPNIASSDFYELARASSAGLPFQKGDVVRAYQAGALNAEQNVLAVTEFITRRENFDILQAVSHALKKKIVSVQILGISEGVDFLNDPDIQNNAALGFGNWLSIFLLLGFLVSLPIAQNIRLDRKIESLKQAITLVEPEAIAIRQALNKVQADKARLDLLEQTKSENADALAILLALTDKIEVDSYLTRLEMNGRKVQISGLSDNSAKLFESLENTPQFQGVQFVGAMTKDPATQKERFSLILQMPSGSQEGSP